MIFFFKGSFFCPKQQANDPLQICCPLEGIQPQIEEKPTLPDKDECGTQTGAPASCTLYNKVSILGVAALWDNCMAFPADLCWGPLVQKIFYKDE